MKGLLLLSGGLDSRLAARLLQEQGVELEAVNFNTIFCTCTAKRKDCSEAASAAREYKIPLKVYNTTKEIMDVVERPRFGYGRGVNPCIDCRIVTFKKAKEHMSKNGASFIVTGEVLGERPMSQRKDAIKIIEKESGLEGLILRPLSARLFQPTIPEKNSWVDRNKLLDIKGRSRKPQIKLAKELGVNDYPCPAGGCLLTNKDFAKRVRDLIKYKEWNLENALLLKYGRHFRISPSCKVVVGRNEKENEKISFLKREQDTLFRVKSHPGPVAILKGKPSDSEEDVTARLTAYFVTKREQNDRVRIEIDGTRPKKTVEVSPLNSEKIASYRITAG